MRARGTCSIAPTSMSEHLRYRNSSALSAWFCVDALTRSSDRQPRQKRATISGAPSVDGCAFLWNTMYRRIQ